MKRSQHKLFKDFIAYAAAHDLLLPGQKILLALSGGRDSVTLLDLLLHTREQLGFTLAVAHLDHGLRGEASAEDSLFVQRLCEERALEYRCGYADVAALSGGSNVEDTARRVRYEFLQRTALELGCDCIATAHHADDQAETVLLHLLRGGGPQGLAAMRPREVLLIRPLLFAEQSAIAAYSERFALRFCEDASNLEQKYLRNKLRLSLLPQLAAEYNPHIRANLCATAEICRAENQLMSELAEDCWQCLRAADGSLDIAEMAALPLALARRVVRLAFSAAGGAGLTFKQTEALLALAESSSLDLPGLAAHRRGGRLFFGPLPGDEKALAANWREPVDPCYWRTLPGNEQWQYMAEILPIGKQPSAYPPECDRIIIAWPAEVYFAGRRDGDKMAVMGMQGRKSIKSIYQEARVPLEERVSRPILYQDDLPLWLPFLKRARADWRTGERLAIYCRRLTRPTV